LAPSASLVQMSGPVVLPGGPQMNASFVPLGEKSAKPVRPAVPEGTAGCWSLPFCSISQMSRAGEVVDGARQ
jgi:hypothetical protein